MKFLLLVALLSMTLVGCGGGSKSSLTKLCDQMGKDFEKLSEKIESGQSVQAKKECESIKAKYKGLACQDEDGEAFTVDSIPCEESGGEEPGSNEGSGGSGSSNEPADPVESSIVFEATVSSGGESKNPSCDSFNQEMSAITELLTQGKVNEAKSKCEEIKAKLSGVECEVVVDGEPVKTPPIDEMDCSFE